MVESLFGALLVVCGAYFVYHAFAMSSKLEAAQQWPQVTGTIVESRVKRKGGSKPRYRAKIKYQYEVGGRQYTSKTIVIGGELQGPRARAEALVAKYPEGSAQPVYYDPARPDDACLERVREGGAAEIVGGVVGVLIGMALLLGWIGSGT